MYNQVLQGHALEKLKQLDNDSIDLIVTDPPYGYSFMNKDWDKAVVSTDTWRECLRVLKPGAFAFIMSSPRQDVFCKMMLNLIDAGFRTDFSSIYWAYASGFPKAADVSKLVDKRNGKPRPVRSIELEEYLKTKIKERYPNHHILAQEMGIDESCIRRWTGKHLDYSVAAFIPPEERYKTLKEKLGLDERFDDLIEREEAEREIIGSDTKAELKEHIFFGDLQNAKVKGRAIGYGSFDITKPATEQAKKLEGAYAGFQPKPAVELILVVMKPLEEKTFIDQALSNGKGITWLDDCRIPYQSEDDKDNTQRYNCDGKIYKKGFGLSPAIHTSLDQTGRFPANLLVSDDVLNDGSVHKSGKIEPHHIFDSPKSKNNYGKYNRNSIQKESSYGDSGSFSRYFDLDAWYANKTLPFLIVPKASKGEKNKGLEEMEKKDMYYEDRTGNSLDCFSHHPNPVKHGAPRQNHHPTVKPLKLMSYLITMGSREGDTVLDPFCGSGTVLIAAHELHRKWIGIELNPDYVQIANQRLRPHKEQTRLI